MKIFGALWSNKGTQEPDPRFSSNNTKEGAYVRCIVNEDLIIMHERLDMRNLRRESVRVIQNLFYRD